MSDDMLQQALKTVWELEKAGCDYRKHIRDLETEIDELRLMYKRACEITKFFLSITDKSQLKLGDDQKAHLDVMLESGGK